jgi:outer membrane autotransporter protein
VDDFDERGGDGSLAFSIDDQENTSVTSVVGLSGSLPVSTGFGVVSPYLRVEWVHEYMDQADNLKGFLIVIPEAKFELKPRSVDRDYVNFGGGISTVLKDGISVFVDYDGLFFYKNLESHQVTLGGRLAF